MTDQIVKQIQLNGGTSGETDSLFSYLFGEMSEVEGLAYQVSCSGSSSRIQIGSPFYVTVTGRRCQRALLEVKEEPMHKKIIWDERGGLSFFTVFVILTINMLLAFVLLFASVKTNCINIRNAAKMELNNVSARIYADTFHSQREANLDSYMADLHLSSAYQEALRAGFILGMEERIHLTSSPCLKYYLLFPLLFFCQPPLLFLISILYYCSYRNRLYQRIQFRSVFRLPITRLLFPSYSFYICFTHLYHFIFVCS